MKTSESIIKIIPALLSSQKKIEAVTKTANNPFFHSKYADLNSLIDACKDILNINDIVILQPIEVDYVETILLHTSGEWISSVTKIVAKTDTNPQDQGSAITYARRYGLQSMLFMSAEDDDGEKATSHASPTAPKPTVVSKPTTTTTENIIEPLEFKTGFNIQTIESGFATATCVCGQHMYFRGGVNKKGQKWTGLLCESKEQNHTIWSPKVENALNYQELLEVIDDKAIDKMPF